MLQKRILLAGAAVAGLALGSTVAQADSVADFYKGKTLRVIVASSAGGGYDAYARALAAHIVKYIPGNPNAVVQNMPGAGGLRAANYIYNLAPKDGTVFGHVQRTAPFHAILGRPGAKFDPNKFNWIGSLNNEVTICVLRKDSKVQNFNQLLTTQAYMGGSGIASDSETVPTILKNTLGAKFVVVSGYPGSTETALAVERKEIDGMCGSYSSLTSAQKRWFQPGKEFVNIILQASTRKHPAIPNIPLSAELAGDPTNKAILELNDSRLEMGRPFVAPPGIPEERARALRDAFDKMVKDPAFIAHIKKLGRELNPVSGADVAALVARVTKSDPKVIEGLNEALKYKGTKLKAKIAYVNHSGKVTGTKKGGRRIMIMHDGKEVMAKVSGSRTKVTLDGKKVKRKAIKIGMTCTFKYTRPGAEATNIDCKS